MCSRTTESCFYRCLILDEVGIIAADLIHLTASQFDNDSNYESGNDGDDNSCDCHDEGSGGESDDADKDGTEPSADSVEVVNTHHIEYADLAAEPGVQIDETYSGKDSCNDSDEECSPGSNLEERCTDCNRTTEHCVGVDEGVDLTLKDHAHSVCTDDRSDTCHVTGNGSHGYILGGSEKRGNEGGPKHPKEHACEPNEGHTVSGGVHGLIECPLIPDSQCDSDTEVCCTHVDQDGSSVIDDGQSDEVIESTKDKPLDERVYEGECDSDKEVLPHLTGSKEHSDCDDDSDSADYCSDQKLLAPKLLKSKLLNSEVDNETCCCRKENCECGTPLELLDENHQEGDQHQHEPNIQVLSELELIPSSSDSDAEDVSECILSETAVSNEHKHCSDDCEYEEG